MLKNSDMKPNRFRRWAQSRARVAKIKAALLGGGSVTVGTYTRATRYTAKHADWFKATKSGTYVRQGGRWDYIDYAAIIINQKG